MALNQLFFGDNLEVLRQHIRDVSVDLVYLDPPFNSRQDYNVLFKEKDGARSASQITAFEDTWEWNEDARLAYEELIEKGGRVADVMRAFKLFLFNSDMMAYLAMMAPRLVELHRVLKPTGSIYLHCDPTASHYLKILMDAVFGPENFRNEVIWKRTHAHGGANRFGRVHDTLLFYGMSEATTWNKVKVDYTDDYLNSFFKFRDEDGRRYRATILTGSGLRNGESGKQWRHIDPSASGRHWAIPGYLRTLLPQLKGKGVHDALDELDRAGRLIWPKKESGSVSFKQYQDDLGGSEMQDVIVDVKPISAQAQERLGYPTQKPEALLERLVAASSNEGDVVLDPFCGCGTAIAVSQRLKRKWVGIDITHLAVGLIKQRLKDAFGESIRDTYEVIGEPVSLPDAEVLARQDPFQFQAWALSLVGARTATSARRGADQGIDGRLYFHDDKSGDTKQIIFSVKSGHVGVAQVRDLRGVLERENAEIAVFVTLEPPSKPMLAEATEAGFYTSEHFDEKFPRLQILTIEQLLGGASVRYPRLLETTFKRAPKAKAAKAQQQLDLEGPF